MAELPEAEINLAIEALWENSIDGRYASAFFENDFDRAEKRLEESFREWLKNRQRQGNEPNPR